MDFNKFKQTVAKQFAKMSSKKLFVVDVDRDELWNLYLDSFPEGTNPIYRERREYDCSCCRQFIKNIGGVVTLDGDTIWDAIVGVPAFDIVSEKMASYVASKPIKNFYLHYEKSVGTDKNFEQLVGSQKTWEHFHVNLPPSVVKPKHKIPTLLGTYQSTHDVFKRALTELTAESVEMVLELIDQKSLYKGDEYKATLTSFLRHKEKFDGSDKYVWGVEAPHSLSHIRNTSIGTLLTDLSEGMELDAAVRRFEAVVAPANYKRPKAIVTQRQIDDAKKTIEDLGLTSALERRYARENDLTINNVLFASREARKNMSDNALDMLKPTKKSVAKFDKVEEVHIDDFIENILPKIDSMEVLFENKHANNLVSLVAPVDPTAGRLFKWENNFSWSYNGEVTDSIKERVKAAGGRVDGDVCCRLAWYNTDDLDLHIYEPTGNRIYFSNRRMMSRNGGMLDVDANGMDGQREDPCENIVYANKKTMARGIYKLVVHQWSLRNPSKNVGFEVEIEIEGKRTNFFYTEKVKDDQHILVANIIVGDSITIEPMLPSSAGAGKEIWGITTNDFVPVKMLMNSPNFWDGHQTGNKHFFFMLKDCQNPDTARGFYNEFLKPELEVHRRVFELLGSKLKVPASTDQLSGLGFSSTQRNTLMCRVKGSFTRQVNIIF